MPSHDTAKRRKTKRAGRERGCWLYITADELAALGIDPAGPPPYFRVWASGPRPRLVVNLYREP